MRILVVEDEPRMQELLRKGLQEHGHTVMTTGDGTLAAELALEHTFDVIVLDIGLPGMNGYEVAQILRTRNNRALILMLTAFDQEEDVVHGLNLGADDYLKKPFSFSELLARVRSLTRPVVDLPPTLLQMENLIVDLTLHTVHREGKLVPVTRTEFLLLQYLMEHSPHIVPRKALMESIWGVERDAGRGTLDTLMNGLRNKIDVPFQHPFIHTVRGAGYYVGKKLLEK
ncbi:MAG TPA: response regulator transcription factor [Acidobacteriaceae bacterium]|jgi:DNA-binding response OmpR family regulator|nr:response regulator transcription factor [Acidobacteriaceae bacterium]